MIFVNPYNPLQQVSYDLIADDAAPWAFLAQRMVTEAVSTRVLDAKYPTTKDLGKVKNDTPSDACMKVNGNHDLKQ